MTDFITLAKSRYSVRKYGSTPVEEEKIAKILEAAQASPTACNYQPQRIYAVCSNEMRRALAGVTPCTFDAPVVFVVCYDENEAAKGMVHPGYTFGITDAAIVCCHMMLEATELGLGSCWVGRFNEKEVKDVLGLPENIRVCDLLPVGYAASDARPSQLHVTRKPTEQTVKYL